MLFYFTTAIASVTLPAILCGSARFLINHISGILLRDKKPLLMPNHVLVINMKIGQIITLRSIIFGALLFLMQFSSPAHAGMRSEELEFGTEEALSGREDAAGSRLRGLLGGELNYAAGIKEDSHYRGRLVPLFRVEYDDWLYATNLGGSRRAGVWLWQTPNHMQKFGLSVQTHSARTAFDNKVRREDSIDAALNIQWKLPERYLLRVSYLRDIGNVNHAQSLDVSVTRNFIYRQVLFNHDCMLAPGISLEWESASLVDYYYGVRPEEAGADRPVYVGRDTVNGGVRLTAFYLIYESWTVFGGVHTAFFGAGITDSPIVTRHIATRGYFGTAWLF